MHPRNPKHFLVVLVYAIATIVLGLIFWLGPLAYGVSLLRADKAVAGAIVTVLGAGWAFVLARDAHLPGMLWSAVHSVLIFAGLAEDPWEGER